MGMDAHKDCEVIGGTRVNASTDDLEGRVEVHTAHLPSYGGGFFSMCGHSVLRGCTPILITSCMPLLLIPLLYYSNSKHKYDNRHDSAQY